MFLKILGAKKKNEYLFKKEFHEKLEKILKQKYDIEAKYTENFSWGYTSTSTYIKDKDDNEYVARLSNNTPEKLAVTKKDIKVTEALKEKNLSVKLRDYLENVKGKFITSVDDVRDQAGNILLENKILMVHPYIQGTPPFDMSEDVLKQAVELLFEIHKINPGEIDFPLEKLTDDADKWLFLHGDMTP